MLHTDACIINVYKVQGFGVYNVQYKVQGLGVCNIHCAGIRINKVQCAEVKSVLYTDYMGKE